jgi:hypothetical protein
MVRSNMKFNNKVVEMWAKWFVGNLITAIVVIGKTPLDFTTSDWHHAANTIWLAIVPVVIAWANPKHNLTMRVTK